MGVDGNRWMAKSDIQDDAGGFAADARQGFESLGGLRHFAGVQIHQHFASRNNVFGFGAVEPDALDVMFEAGYAERVYRLRRAGVAIEFARCQIDTFVGRLG